MLYGDDFSAIVRHKMHNLNHTLAGLLMKQKVPRENYEKCEKSSFIMPLCGTHVCAILD